MKSWTEKTPAALLSLKRQLPRMKMIIFILPKILLKMESRVLFWSKNKISSSSHGQTGEKKRLTVVGKPCGCFPGQIFPPSVLFWWITDISPRCVGMMFIRRDLKWYWSWRVWSKFSLGGLWVMVWALQRGGCSYFFIFDRNNFSVVLRGLPLPHSFMHRLELGAHLKYFLYL